MSATEVGAHRESASPAPAAARAAPSEVTRPARPAGAAVHGGPPAVPVVVVASAVAAAGVVLRHLGTKPLWRDEAISVSVATRPVARILSVLPHHDANAGLYYLLLHTWLWFGRSPAWARGLSAVCFIATAATVAGVASRWRGWEVGLACGLLIAVNPFLVYYGQETRPYALAVLLAAISTGALFWNGPQPAARVYLVATVALIYADLFAVLYVAALAAVVVAYRRLRCQPVPPALIRYWWIVAGFTAPLAAGMAIFERGQISWLPRPTFGVLVRTFTAMGSGWLGLEVMLVLAGVALAAGGRAGGRAGTRDGDREAPVVVALAAAFVGPPIALWSFAQLIPAFVDRYVICSALALVGLAGAGLSILRHRAGRAGRAVAGAVLAALLLLGGQQTAHLQAEPFKVDDAPAVVAFIGTRSRAGDAVVYAGGGLRILLESARGGGTDFPPDIALAPGGEEFRQHDLYAREVDPAQLASRLDTVQRLWLVTDPGDQRYPQGGPFAALKTMVTATFAPGPSTSFGAIDVTLLVRRP